MKPSKSKKENENTPILKQWETPTLIKENTSITEAGVPGGRIVREGLTYRRS